MVRERASRASLLGPYSFRQAVFTFRLRQNAQGSHSERWIHWLVRKLLDTQYYLAVPPATFSTPWTSFSAHNVVRTRLPFTLVVSRPAVSNFTTKMLPLLWRRDAFN
jgi:hypothetical protein